MSTESTELCQLKASTVVEPKEIEDDMLAHIIGLVESGKQPALSLEGEGEGFTNEREITSPVTKDSLAALINDVRTTMKNTPLPWTLALVHPYVDPSLPGLRITCVTTVGLLAEFVK